MGKAHGCELFFLMRIIKVFLILKCSHLVHIHNKSLKYLKIKYYYYYYYYYFGESLSRTSIIKVSNAYQKKVWERFMIVNCFF